MPWNRVNIINADLLNNFFIKFVQRRRAQSRSIQKHTTSLQNWTSHIEKLSIIVNELPEVKNSMTTQAQGRSDSLCRLMHEIDPHQDTPMRVLSIDEENMI